jgi:NDP-sugar pyrophosphorylase family protein
MATDDYWIDVGRPELLLQANLDRLAGLYDTTLQHPASGGNGIDPDATIAIDALLSGSVVAADAEVGSRSVVTRSVLLAGAVGVSRAGLRRDGSRGHRARLRGAVIGAAAEVEPGQEVTDERLRIRLRRQRRAAAGATARSDVLGIGGAGFIGSHLVDRLVGAGAAVGSPTTCRPARQPRRRGDGGAPASSCTSTPSTPCHLISPR